MAQWSTFEEWWAWVCKQDSPFFTKDENQKARAKIAFLAGKRSKTKETGNA